VISEAVIGEEKGLLEKRREAVVREEEKRL